MKIDHIYMYITWLLYLFEMQNGIGKTVNAKGHVIHIIIKVTLIMNYAYNTYNTKIQSFRGPFLLWIWWESGMLSKFKTFF